jgi:hypothetical protein
LGKVDAKQKLNLHITKEANLLKKEIGNPLGGIGQKWNR